MPDEAVDPVVAMFAIDDEQTRGRPQPEAEINVDPPEDKPAPERDEKGQFKGKDEKPAKEPAKEPETKADDKPAAKEPAKEPAKAEEKREDTIPLAKYLREKNELKEQLVQRDITLKQYEQRLAALEAKTAPKAEPAPEPDFVENPKGYVDHKVSAALRGIEEANKKAEESGKAVQATAEAVQQREQMQQLMGEVQAQERAVYAQNADYYDALSHLRNIRTAQLREFNPEITDAEIRQTIVQEETALAVQLVRAGRNPSQTAYNLAKTYGYQPKAATPTPTPEPTPAPVAKLPEPTNRRLPPDQTLGAGAGGDGPVYKDDEVDPVDVALASLRKKSA